MPSKPGLRIRCGARSRRNGGAPCQKWAVKGSKRCSMHGGTHPKGGAAPQARQRLKHGLFAKTLLPEEASKFSEAFAEMLDDPSMALLADAAFLRTKASTVAALADDKGMYVAQQTAHRRTSHEPVFDDNGRPLMYVTDDGERKPVIKTMSSEETSAARTHVLFPVAELLMKAGRMIESAVGVKKKTGEPDSKRNEISREDALALTREIFGEGGALDPAPASGGADGPVSKRGPAEED